MMSKVADWGRWVVAGVFAAKGALFSYHFVLDLTNDLRTHVQMIGWGYLIPIVCITYLVCAWGLLRWRHWSYVIAITLSVMELGVVAFAAHLVPWSALDRNTILWSIVTCVLLIWLLTPPMRTGYSQRGQIA